MDLTAELARELWSYCPDTGVLVWRVNRPFNRVQGKPTGSVCGDRYLCVQYQNKNYRVHRVIWLMVTGAWPNDELDHINGDRGDNRWVNLREATRVQQNYNRKSWGTYPKGVRKANSLEKPYRAYITIDGKHKHLGVYKTPEEAHEAYKAAATELHGEFFFDGER